MGGFEIRGAHVCNGPIFSSFLPLVLLYSGFPVSDCHSPFSFICTAFCVDACWLKANQSVCTHEMSFVCCVTEKGFH